LLVFPVFLFSTVKATPVPGATITLIGGQTVNVFSSDSFTVTFTTAQTGLSASNFTVTGTVTGAFVSSVTGSGTSWTVRVNIPSSFQSQGTFTLNLANSTNLSPGLSGLPVVGPTVQVIAYPLDGSFTLSSTNANSGYAKTGDQINFTLTSAHYELENWSVNIAGQNTGGSLNFSPVASGQVTLGSGTAQGPLAWSWSYTNTFNESNSGSGTSGIIFDSINPTVSIGAPSASTTSSAPIRYNVTYADANFNTSTLSASNITLNTTGTATGTIALTENTATNYTVTIFGITGAGTLGISIAAGTASDMAGNLAPASSPSTLFSVVPASPTTTIISSNLNPSYTVNPNHTVTFTATVTSFGTPVTVGTVNFTSDGVNIAGGSSVVLNSSGQATLTTTFDTVATHKIQATYNANSTYSSSTSSTLTQQVILHPTSIASLSKTGSSPTNASSVQYTATFAAAITGLSASNFSLATTGSVSGANVASVSGSGTTYTVTVNTGSGTGNLTLNLANATGLSPGISNTLPYAGDTYAIDNTAPTLTSLVYQSNNARSNYAKVGDVVSLSFGANEALQTPSVTIGGHAVTATNTGGNNYLASYTLTSGDTEGRIHFTLNIADLAGNTGVYNDVAAGDDIEFDMTSPTATISAPSVTSIGAGGAGTVSYTVTYADANFNTSSLSTAGITLNTTGTATGTVGISGSGTGYTVTISSITGAGTLGISVGAGYANDLAGNTDLGAASSATFTVLSNDATLSNLTLNAGLLTPLFSPGTTSYTRNLVNGVQAVTIVPTTNDPGATVLVNGTETVASGATSNPIPVSVGTNTIAIQVTAADGATTQTYTMTLIRAGARNDLLASLKVSKGVKDPVFKSNVTDYSVSVANGVSSISVTAAPVDPNATLLLNGTTALASGAASDPIALSVGANIITVQVTAQNDTATRTYTVTVTRAVAKNDNLASLKISRGALSPGFAVLNTSYTANVVNGVTSLTVTPTAADPNATMLLNGTTAIASGAASDPITLAIGANTITIKVTAADGVTSQTYTVTVTRAARSINIPDESLSVDQPVISPPIEDDVILVHQGVSPNGDGINDFLVIDGILAYPDNKLSVMNRNGALVFETRGYDNTSKVFDGHSNKNGKMQLPGTYFYSLEYTVGGIIRHKTGYLVLKY